MAKFRNMLVHIYWKIGGEKVYEMMKKDVSDLEKFIEEVKNYVDR
jgi:uncharacterized protein YutE (UPF0331/DUF86 family)